MINQLLHRRPEPLDADKHRQLRLAWPVTDWSPATRLNALFVATAEFADACREFPVVFLRAGKDDDGREQVAPVAVMGVMPEQNLFVDGTRWRARYMPAVLNAYPFCIGYPSPERIAVCLDMEHAGIGTEGGLPLFDDGGQPADLLKAVQKQFQALDAEIQRTRAIGQYLLQHDLLSEMQFDASLPGGKKHRVDGFLTVDQKKMQDLPDAKVGEMHRSGVLGLVHLHWLSLTNMPRLLEWHLERAPALADAPAAGDTPAAADAPAAGGGPATG